MVDTVRTQNDLLTNLFQDNQINGSITPQDMRDLIISLTPSSATGKFDTPAATPITIAGIFYSPTSGTSSIVNGTADIDMPQAGRIRYIGVADRHFMLSVSITATVAGNNQDIRFQLTKNGTALPETIVARTWGTGADGGNLAMNTSTILATNDYIELQVSNDTSTSTVTITNGAINMHGHIK